MNMCIFISFINIQVSFLERIYSLISVVLYFDSETFHF